MQQQSLFNLHCIDIETAPDAIKNLARKDSIICECNSNGLSMEQFSNIMIDLQNSIGNFQVTYGKDTSTFIIVLKPIKSVKSKITNI